MSLRGQAENPCLPDHEAGKVDSLFCYRTGQAVFDVDDAMAREIYADNPVLPRFYKSYADLVYFRLSAATLDYYDLTPGKATGRTAADWIDSCVITEAGNMLLRPVVLYQIFQEKNRSDSPPVQHRTALRYFRLEKSGGFMKNNVNVLFFYYFCGEIQLSIK